MSYESQSDRYYLESLQSELAVLRRQVENADTELSSLREDCAQRMTTHEDSLEDFVSMEEHLKLTLSASEMIFSQQMEEQTYRIQMRVY